MSAIALLTLAGVGLFSGFAAGLIGIGGGVLIVPFLYFFYANPAWSGYDVPLPLHVAVAHATSLLVILPTAARGAWSYARKDLIEWPVALPMAVAAVFGSLIGVRIAVTTPAEILKFFFGLLLIGAALHLLWKRHGAVTVPVRTNLIATTLTGLAVGALSGAMGVGGGILALPLLINVLHVDVRRAAATSLVIVGAAALTGIAGYIVSGLGVGARPPGSIGYVHLYAALPILIGSVIAVPWGAAANQKMPIRALKLVFALLFLALGLRFLIENSAIVLGGR